MTMEKLDSKIEATCTLWARTSPSREPRTNMYAAIDGLIDKLDPDPQAQGALRRNKHNTGIKAHPNAAIRSMTSGPMNRPPSPAAP